jgi:hypothetical protein
MLGNVVIPRHPGPDPGPMNTVGYNMGTCVFMGPGFRRDDVA